MRGVKRNSNREFKVHMWHWARMCIAIHEELKLSGKLESPVELQIKWIKEPVVNKCKPAEVIKQIQWSG